MKPFITNLWFDNQAEEAAKFYTTVFKDGEILHTMYYPTDTPSHKEVGSVLTVGFTVNGQEFLALNGGPLFTFTEAISFIITCDTQEEIDYYWEKLSAVPESEQCGWLKDKFGVSWQVVPKQLSALLSGPHAKEIMEKFLPMKKLIIAELEQAAHE